MGSNKVILLVLVVGLGSLSGLAQNWTRHTIDGSSSGADGVRLADVNNDGLPDISTGWEEAGFTKVYLHPGYARVKGTWPSVITGQTPSVEDAVLADLDQDGAMDVISSTEGESKKMYVQWAPPDNQYLNAKQWKNEPIPSSEGVSQWMFACPYNLDGKNGIDIIAGSKGNSAVIGWFKSPPNPRQLDQWTWHQIGDATWVMSLILHDVNKDGYIDIVLSDRKPGITNGIRWLQHPGKDLSDPWENHFIGAQGKEVAFMHLTDLDGDGLIDAVGCDRTDNQILLFERIDDSGLNWKEYQFDIPENAGTAKAVRAGDIDQDGRLDIVYSANTMGIPGSSGVFWLSYKDKPFSKDWSWHPISGPVGYKFDRLELLDLDGDGDLDVLTCEENYGPDSKGLGVIWYENPD